MCLVLPSRREGYGLVVIEAAAHGTPSVVVADPDNAAVELVTEGVNGFIARVSLARRSRRRDRPCAPGGTGSAGVDCRLGSRGMPSCCRWSVRSRSRSASTRAGAKRALIAGQRARRRGRPAEACRTLPPGRSQPVRLRGIAEQSLNRAGDRASRLRVERQRSVARHLRRVTPRAEHATGTPRAIASSTGRPNPSYSDGNTKQCQPHISPPALRRRPTAAAAPVASAAGRDPRAKLALVGCRIAGYRPGVVALLRAPRSTGSGSCAAGGRRTSGRRRAGVEALAPTQLRLRRRRDRVRHRVRAEPRRSASPATRAVAQRPGVCSATGDHPVRASRAEPNEHDRARARTARCASLDRACN